MVANIKEPSKMINNTGAVLLIGLMAESTVESTKMECAMAKESIRSKMEIVMREVGKIINNMGRAHT